MVCSSSSSSSSITTLTLETILEIPKGFDDGDGYLFIRSFYRGGAHLTVSGCRYRPSMIAKGVSAIAITSAPGLARGTAYLSVTRMGSSKWQRR